jgi:3-demethoxyubiquinol 3-hydroxylase
MPKFRDADMDARDRLTIARILKVNHAGEYGAIRIYRAQLWLARRIYPDVVEFLEETLGHEIEHCAMFLRAMPRRNARPCRIMALWGHGGQVLGFLTALLGRKGIWICTAAVEATVHRHLEEQLNFLLNTDSKLHGLISAIQEEELMHLRHAEQRMGIGSVWSRSLSAGIATATEAVIWLSTWGDSTRMAKELAAARPAV